MGVTLLLDADSLVWSSCYDKETADYHTDINEAAKKYDESIDSIVSALSLKLDIENLITFNGSRGNFRKFIGSNNVYKANREKTKRPEILNELHDYVNVNYDGIRGYGVETDDMVATKWAKLSKEKGRDSVMIISIDKDYRQLPCLLFNYHPKHDVIYDISEEEARHNFYEQILCGDSSDNINFLTGKGKAYFKKHFSECKSDFQYMKKLFFLFKAKYKSKAREKYIECHNLLKLRRE
jgi:5'-3' exonuclease